MFKFVVVFVALLALSQTGFAKNECKDPSTGKQYNAGEKFSVPGQCAKMTCHENGSISGVSCGVFALSPDSKCKIVEQDNSKPYPECCRHPVCDNN